MDRVDKCNIRWAIERTARETFRDGTDALIEAVQDAVLSILEERWTPTEQEPRDE